MYTVQRRIIHKSKKTINPSIYQQWINFGIFIQLKRITANNIDKSQT